MAVEGSRTHPPTDRDRGDGDPRRLVVLGLGPGDPGLRTLAAQRALDGARRIVLRTAVHPGLDDLVGDPRVSACDDLYDTLPSFDLVYAAIVERVLARAALPGTTVYAVPGHPLFGERTVGALLDEAARNGPTVDVIAGISALDVVATSLGVDPMERQVQLVDAVELQRVADSAPFGAGAVTIDPYRPVLVGQVYAAAQAGATKLVLGDMFPAGQRASVVRAAGSAAPAVEPIPLHELDRVPVDHLTSVWIPPVEDLGATRSFPTLERVVARLRAPGGCPWDRAQTHESLREAVLNEAYEVADAIDAGDLDNLTEELGDLLLLVLMHAQIADETGGFALGDVLEAVTTKLIRRHPHVFGDRTADSPDEVVKTWNEVKAEERRLAGAPPKAEHPVDRLPRSMPVLAKATRLIRAADDGGPPTWRPDLGVRLLEAVEAVVWGGEDPETELLAALRRNYGPDRPPTPPYNPDEWPEPER
jgi:tetrapyrrole methylase family protein/MazG family protein